MLKDIFDFDKIKLPEMVNILKKCKYYSSNNRRLKEFWEQNSHLLYEFLLKMKDNNEISKPEEVYLVLLVNTYK